MQKQKQAPIKFTEYDKDTLIFLFSKTRSRMSFHEYGMIVFGLMLSVITEIVCLSKGVFSYYPPLGIMFFLFLYSQEYDRIAAMQLHRLALRVARGQGLLSEVANEQEE